MCLVLMLLAYDAQISCLRPKAKLPFLTEWRIKLIIDCMMKYESYQLVYSAIHYYRIQTQRHLDVMSCSFT